MSKLKKLIVEIHRRSLWQVLLVYVGAAWACFELIDAVTERLGLPVWLPGLAIVLFLLGLPFVVATGLVREEAAPSAIAGPGAEIKAVETGGAGGTRRRRFLTWRNAGLSFLVALALWGVVAAGWMLFGELPSDATVERKSIAVLPFDNIGGAEENIAFTDGIHDDIITHLQKIGDLTPISRTSVMEYRDATKNLREIADELGVATILEGGVQRSGDRVRINAQLIDAETDEHLWAEVYDRELTGENIFAIQSEIARQIAVALKATLTPAEIEQVERRPTESLEAYDYYLTGLDYSRRGSGQDNLVAAESYQRAIELDPSFALAHAKLSEVQMQLWRRTTDHTPERLQMALAAAESALALAPMLPEAHLAMGSCHYFGHRDNQRASEHYSIAKELSPNNPEVLARLAIIQRRQGQVEQSLDGLTRAVELSPRDPAISIDVAASYYMLRDYASADRYIDRAIAIVPDLAGPYHWKAWNAINRSGGLETAWQAVQGYGKGTGPRVVPGFGADRFRNRAVLRVFKDRYRWGEDYRARTETWGADNPVDYFLSHAILYQLGGQTDLSQAFFDSARVVIEQRVEESPEDPFEHANLGFVYASLGRTEDAIQEGLTALRLDPISENLTWGRSHVATLAEIYVTVGEHEAAIEQLESLISCPVCGPLSTALLRIDPVWDPLRDHPRFQALLEQYDQPVR